MIPNWSSFLHFLNLQYWYCVIYSLFGGKCTDASFNTTPSAQKPEGFNAFTAFVHWIVNVGTWTWHAISGVVTFLWHAYSLLAYTYSGIVGFGILLALGGFLYIRTRDLGVYGTLPPEEERDDSRMKRWKELLALAMTTDPKNWKAAITEADHLLGELLASLKYQGMNTAERMRALPENAFSTVPVAWEAHRIKNMLSSGDFILTQREAFRVMKLYEQVFEEFHYL